MRVRWWPPALAAVVVISATAAHHFVTRPTRDESIAALGKRIFFDSTLSASGRQSCASCHNPNFAYAAPNSLAVQLGGASLDVPGTRAVPSLRYVLNRTPKFYKSYAMNLKERVLDSNEPPSGGFGWDGRFASAREQAAFPLLDHAEMANPTPGAVVAKISRSAYAREFQRIFGDTVFTDTASAFAHILEAIERFEFTDESFHPYDSKYDEWLDGKVQLTAQERRGMDLFNDATRGNCASCHRSQKGADGSHPLFTDFQFGAIGVPRNDEIAANRDSSYYDEGLCGPVRRDQVNHQDYCGMFKTPSLRNVARRGAFFHNGRFHTLEEALKFYVRRDTDPHLWYSRDKSGRLVRFDDLPASLRSNVDTLTEPLTRKAGEKPAWSDAEVQDVIAFLKTLSDKS